MDKVQRNDRESGGAVPQERVLLWDRQGWKLWDKGAANSADGNPADVPELAAATSAETKAVWEF